MKRRITTQKAPAENLIPEKEPTADTAAAQMTPRNLLFIPQQPDNQGMGKKMLGLRWQLLIGFAIFTVVIVALLWIFQILLLNTFYEAIKTSEVISTADTIEKNLENDNIMEVIADIMRSTSTNIRVTDEIGRELISVRTNPYKTLQIEKYSQLELIIVMDEVKILGGTYLKKPDTYAGAPNNNIIYYRYVQTESGNHRLILIETEITPVDSTVDTLKVQLICLTIVMVILGIGLALFIAGSLSKPIVKINESAKNLAEGNYDIEFEPSGSREVKELADTLNYAATELSKVEALRRELLANVSHDLRTPLTMIKGYSEVMRDLPGENTPENVQIIIDEASRLTDLVNDLLDLSKLEAGASPLDTSRYNLTESIKEILLRYDKLADYNFIFEHDEDVFVRADKLKISQVIYNLVNNAVHYVGNDKTITVKQVVTDNTVRIEVIDKGPGIAPDKLKDIWDRYYKVDKEHKRASVGTGLGLSIVKNILNLHGGTYGVSSKLGEGSLFWFELETAGSE